MLAEERRHRLLEFVRVRQFAILPELIEQLGVSESTVRRDLDYLEEAGSARRIHGGVLYTGGWPKLPHFDGLASTQWVLKKAVARRAAELVEDGDTVLRQHDLRGGPLDRRAAAARGDQFAAGGESFRIRQEQ
jgi:DeoR/GlpR family transcriptional regulator of sugar metabolism